MDYSQFINNNINQKHGDTRDNGKNNNNNNYNQYERRPKYLQPLTACQYYMDGINYVNRKYNVTSEPVSPNMEAIRPSLSLRAASYQTAANHTTNIPNYNNKTLRSYYHSLVESHEDSFANYRAQGSNYFKQNFGEQQRNKQTPKTYNKYSPPPFVHQYNVQSQTKRNNNNVMLEIQQQKSEKPLLSPRAAYSFPRDIQSSMDTRRVVNSVKLKWEPSLPSMSLRAASLQTFPPTSYEITDNKSVIEKLKEDNESIEIRFKKFEIKSKESDHNRNQPNIEEDNYNKNVEENNNLIESQSQSQSQNNLLKEIKKVSSSESLRSNSSENRSGKHYQHYYSNPHNPTEIMAEVKTIPTSIPSAMSFVKTKHLPQEASSHDLSNTSSNQYVFPEETSYIDAQHIEHNNSKANILKEKTNNNNDFYCYDINDLHSNTNEDNISAASSLNNLNIEDEYNQKLSYEDLKDNTKRNAYKSSDSNEKISLKKSISSTEKLGTNVNNNNNNNYTLDERFSATEGFVDIEKGITSIPITPAKVKSVTSIKKGSPAHRVLLYNRQSPRLPRNPLVSKVDNKSRRLRVRGGRNNNIIVEENLTPTDNVLEREIKADYINEKDDVVVELVEGKMTGILGQNNCDSHSPDTLASDDDDYDLDDLPNCDDSDSGSDSEDAYRSYISKLSQSFKQSHHEFVHPAESDDSIANPATLLVPSLFPNVPPYLSFSSSTAKGPNVPYDLFRVLKWRMTNVMPKVVRNILSNSGMRLIKKTNDWMGIWGKHMKSPCFKTIRPHQKINHLPGSFKIGRKDSCWKNLQKQMQKHGKKDFGFMPKTYIIPHDLGLLRKNWMKCSNKNVKWIIKPPASARGTGIRVINKWSQIPKRKALIVQKYIERPLLISGNKFDLRLYVLVTSINPLRVYMYQNGLARFAAVKYSAKSDTLNDRCMHLTNYSINKFSSNYSKNEDVNACHGHKWTLKSLWSYLAARGIRTDFLWEALRSLVLRTIIAAENSMNNVFKMNVESRYSCFELFGFDVLLDSELVPWLLEVNISPSLHSDLPLDTHVKAPLVQGVLNTALFHVPPKLSVEKQKEIATEMSLPTNTICYDKRMYINYLTRDEKIKHNMFTRKTTEEREEYINTILDNLTPDDVRCLIVAEDELARCTPLERIFPTTETHKYLKFTDGPRYYNRLLDAWESRYGNNRAEGIALLRDFCMDNYHLEVPPLPAKKDWNDDASSAEGNECRVAGDKSVASPPDDV